MSVSRTRRNARSGLQRVPKQPVVAAVCDQLEQRIFDGGFAPGDTLPSERVLGQMLGVSRTAVREAMARLARAGLVAVRQGGVTTVLDYRRRAGLDLLPRLAQEGGGKIRPEVMSAGIEMRAALAPDAARLCALRAPPAVLEALMAVPEQMQRVERGADEVRELQQLSLRFWELVTQGSGNIAYQLAFNTLRAVYQRIEHVTIEAMADEFRDVDGYRAIAMAIDDRDGALAERTAREHVAIGLEPMLAMFGKGARS